MPPVCCVNVNRNLRGAWNEHHTSRRAIDALESSVAICDNNRFHLHFRFVSVTWRREYGSFEIKTIWPTTQNISIWCHAIRNYLMWFIRLFCWNKSCNSITLPGHCDNAPKLSEKPRRSYPKNTDVRPFFRNFPKPVSKEVTPYH